MVADGRWCRCYIAGPPGRDRFYLTVTYHRPARSRDSNPPESCFRLDHLPGPAWIRASVQVRPPEMAVS